MLRASWLDYWLRCVAYPLAVSLLAQAYGFPWVMCLANRINFNKALCLLSSVCRSFIYACKALGSIRLVGFSRYASKASTPQLRLCSDTPRKFGWLWPAARLRDLAGRSHIDGPIAARRRDEFIS